MRAVAAIKHAIYAEATIWIDALRPIWSYGLLGATLLALVLIVQLPLTYTVDVGVEEGYGGDLPLVWWFNTAEDDEHGTYRWTQDGAIIRLPGLGHRPIVARLNFIPIHPNIAAIGPKTQELWIRDQHFATLPVAETGRTYALLIAPHMTHGGTLELLIRTATFTPPDDPRDLGTPLDAISVASVSTPTLSAPALQPVALWLCALLIVRVLLRHAFATSDGQSDEPHATIWIMALASLLIVLAALLDPPRWGYGALPVFIATIASYGLVLILHPVLPLLVHKLGVPFDRRVAGWLLIIVAVAVGMRLGGRLFPLSMWGDIGFHTNRFIDTFGLGEVYLVSRNRGVNFPYPPGPYLTLAPLILPGFDIRLVLQWIAALLDGLSALLVYALVLRALGAAHRTGLIAAALYVFTAAGIMLTWWSFDTHIYAQCASLVVITALLLWMTNEQPNHHQQLPIPNGGKKSQESSDSLSGLCVCAPVHESHASPELGMSHTRWAVLLVVLLSGVFLGHFGFLINTVLMGGLVLLLIWGASVSLSWRGNTWAQRIRWPLTLAYLLAGLLAVVFFYTAYLSLFLYQLNEVTQGGLTGLADRAPVSRAKLWHVLWQAGLIEHFGFFPLVLMPVGMAVLARQALSCWRQGERGQLVLIGLMGCSLLVSLAFAILPFITLSTQSTRWMMFSAWAMAVGGAVGFRHVWQHGRAGRVATLAMAAFVVWNTLVFWLGPLAWRIRPPEPF